MDVCILVVTCVGAVVSLPQGAWDLIGFDTTWGAWDLTLSDTAAVQGAQSALGLLGLITPLWLSVF